MRKYAPLPLRDRMRKRVKAAAIYMAENWKILLAMAAFALASSVNIH